tara:strand:+ start:1336 stop:2640 length:1305 start_codon:yes stop_codon:yes gene_type:complete
MIEIISVFISLISFFLVSNFPMNNFLIKKYSPISFSFSEILLINILFNCNLLLALSFFTIDLNLIFFLLIIPSIVLTLFFFKQYLQLFKNNIYLVSLFLVIYYSISIFVVRNAYLEWDGLEHWIFKSSVYFNGGQYKNLVGLPFDYYPHLGSYLWAFFWKNSILQIEYSGRLFFIFIFLVTIFSLNSKIKSRNHIFQNLIIIFVLSYFSTNFFLFGGYQEYLIFFVFFCYSLFFVKFFLINTYPNYNVYPELILIFTTNLILWIKQEGFFYYIILNIIFLIHAKRDMLHKFIYIIIMAILMLFFVYIKSLYFGSLKFNADIINEETYKIFELKYLVLKIFIITKYFLISFIKYPIWFLIILSSIILHIHFNYFKNNKFILSYILLSFSFVYAVFINEPTDFYYLIPLTLDRIVFAISGFLIFLNVELFNKIKSK